MINDYTITTVGAGKRFPANTDENTQKAQVETL